MKNFGKGIALIVVIVIIASVFRMLFGVVQGTPHEGITIALGCVLCFHVAVKYNAVKPFLVINCGMAVIFLIDCILFFSTGIAILSYVYPLIGNIISIALVAHYTRKNK